MTSTDAEEKKVTLLRRGYLVPPAGATQFRINEMKSAVPRDYIIQMIKQQDVPKSAGSRVFVLKSATGSGKSITIPEALLFRGRVIALTEPSRLSVDEISGDLAKQHKHSLKPKINLGLQTGIVNRSVGEGINVMTPGILRQHFSTMTDEQLMRRYSTFLIDEVHKHEIMLDFLLRDIREFISRNWSNPKCPIVVLMSGTMTPKLYMDYFGTDNLIEVRGTSGAPITEHWPKTAPSDIVTAIADTALSCSGDTLVFLPTVKMIQDIHAAVEARADARQPTKVIEVYSEIMERGESEVKSLGTESKTFRLILATNAAETGVTFPFLKNIIDTGMAWTSIFNPQIGARMLYTGVISRASALQRRGRVGRRNPGDYFPLYTQDTFKSMQEESLPEIYVQDISDQLLRVIVVATGAKPSEGLAKMEYTNKFDPATMGLIHAPTSEMLVYCMEKLYMLGFIDTEWQPTVAGWVASQYSQITVEGARLIISAVQDGEHSAMAGIIIACMQSIGAGRLGATSFEDCLTKYSDIMEQIYLVRESKKLSTNFLQKWCTEHEMNYQAWMNTLELIDQTVIQTMACGFQVAWDVAPEAPENIQEFMVEAYRHNIAVWGGYGYTSLSRGLPIKVKNEAIEAAIKNGSPPAAIITNGFEYRSGVYGCGDCVSAITIDYDRRFIQ